MKIGSGLAPGAQENRSPDHRSVEEEKMGDIVNDLREWATGSGLGAGEPVLFRAADYIEFQSAQIITLREALQNMMGAFDNPVSRRRYPPDDFMQECIRWGRAVLEGGR